MAHILVQCPDCGKHLAADETDPNPIACPVCKKDVPAPPSTLPFSCPSCHQAFKFAKNLAGQRIQCPTCQSTVMLPGKPKPGVKRLSLQPQDEDDPVAAEIEKRLADMPRPRTSSRRGGRWLRKSTIFVVVILLLSAGYVLLKQKTIERDFDAACAFALQHPEDFDSALVKFQDIAERTTKMNFPGLRARAEEQIAAVRKRQEAAKTVKSAEAAYQKGLAELKEIGIVQDNTVAAKWLTEASEKGHQEAQYRLGEIYRVGNGVPQDLARATHWLGEAAEHGHALAQCRLGEMYGDGEGVSKDYAKALSWFQRAANQDEVGAFYHLGQLYSEGKGVDADPKEAEKWFRKAADHGDRLAQTALGMMCLRGQGIPKDEPQAMRWFTVAAEQGDAAAQYNLGRAYLDGTGVAADASKGLGWIRKAAYLGNASAQNDFGMMLLRGQGVLKSELQAADWLSRAAEQGVAVAQYNLGTMYLEGTGVHASAEQAAELFRKAADQGNVLSQTSIGVMYHLGQGVAKDDVQAEHWLTLASDKGEPNAEYNFSQMCFETNSPLHDPAKALEWLRRAAEGGHALAQADLGSMFDTGQGVKKDRTEAIRWYERAGEQGVIIAQYRVSQLYLTGPDSQQDPAKRVKWLMRAAELNHAPAQRDLGICYESGLGVAKDPAQARSWLEKAANQEDSVAQYHMGLIYYEGLGVTANLATAGHWLTRAAEQGNRDALKLLKEQRQKEIEKMPGGVAVTLNSGQVVKGVLISESQDELVVETSYFDRTILTTTSVRKSDAKSIAHETADEKEQRIAYEELLRYRLYPNQVYSVGYYKNVIGQFENHVRSYPDSYYAPQVRRWIVDWTAEMKLAAQGKVKIAGRWVTSVEAEDMVRYRGQWMKAEEAQTLYQREVEVATRNTRDIRDRLTSQREAETRHNTVLFEVEYNRRDRYHALTFFVGRDKKEGGFNPGGASDYSPPKEEMDSYGLLSRHSSHPEAKEARRSLMEAERNSPESAARGGVARFEIRLNPSDGFWYLFRLGAVP